ncbi:MAG: DUF1461 domain-containing protein [Coriobacteriia bacterium]|nr:DUF1461 domain-containing protein [Coriobacteriia bacterium]
MRLKNRSFLGAALIALLSATTALGLAVWIMTAPWFTAMAVPGQADSASAGLSSERMVQLAEDVRLFVTDTEAPDLPEVVDGRPAFDEAAVSHLVDVRDVVIAGRWATLAAAALLLIAGLYATSAGRSADLGAGLRWGGAALLVGMTVTVLAGLSDFGRFFAAFHGVFFEAGTWTFPADSLLILIFPTGFWILAAEITGVISTALGTALVLVGRISLRRP